MKKIFLVLAIAAAAFAAVDAQAQNKSPEAAKAAVEKAAAATENPKQSAKPATWIKYGNALLDAYTNPAGNGWLGMSLQEMMLLGGGEKPQSESTVNVGGREATVFIESAAPPVCPSQLPNGAESVKVRRLAEGKYAADILFSGESGEVTLIFRSGGEERRVEATYGTPSLRIWGRYASGDGYMQKTGTRIAYAVEGNLPKGTVYSFALKGQNAELVEIGESEGYAVVDAVAEGTASLSVTATLPGGGVTEAEATLCTVRGYTTFLFGESAEDFGIGGVKAVGGLTAEGEDIVRSGSALAFMSARGVLFGGDCEGVIFTVSDPELAEVRTEDGVPTLFPKGRGRVTVRAEWGHSGAFGEDISASIVLDVVADGVNVGGSAGLYRAVNAGLPVVLTEDILLGEDMADADGGLSREALSALTSRIDTTADCAYHLALGRETPTVVCAMEFRADVYGNGKTLNAELITQSELFDGPLEFAAMEEVDLILGNKEKTEIEKYLTKEITEKTIVGDIFSYDQCDSYMITGFEGRHKAFVQIQQGCNHRCSYCIIPYARGHNRSVPLPDILSQIRELIKQGFKEICLTGVDICSYKISPETKGSSFSILVQTILEEIPELPSLQFGSLDPAAVDGKLIALIRQYKNIYPHFHLSIQSGDNEVLRQMRRRHTREDVINLCQKIRSVRKDATFGADFICGFPTETDEQFQNTLKLVKEAQINKLHVFPYSERPGTPAAALKQVPVEIRKERARLLRELGESDE